VRRPSPILTVALWLLVLAGCGSSSSGSHSGTASTANSSTPAAVQAVVASFAGAYVRFLDGDGTAARLPDATASVRLQAGTGGAIPPLRRRGTLVMVSLTPAQGAPDRWDLSARDLAHTFYATIDVGVLAGRAIVTGIETPDFEQVLAPPGPQPPPAHAGSLPALNAARVFLAGYLPWLYHEAPLTSIQGASPALLEYLKANTPRVPLTMQGLHPRVAAIAVQRHRGSWQALPNITDGQETYELVLSLRLTAGRWLVTAVANQQ
jgi:hypothetical protein